MIIHVYVQEFAHSSYNATMCGEVTVIVMITFYPIVSRGRRKIVLQALGKCVTCEIQHVSLFLWSCHAKMDQMVALQDKSQPGRDTYPHSMLVHSQSSCQQCSIFTPARRPEAGNFTVGPATSKVCRPCGQATFIPAMWSRMVYHCQWTLTQQDFIQKIYI